MFQVSFCGSGLGHGGPSGADYALLATRLHVPLLPGFKVRLQAIRIMATTAWLLRLQYISSLIIMAAQLLI